MIDERLQLDPARLLVRIDGEEHDLEEVTFRVLSILVEADGALVPDAEFYRRVWGITPEMRLQTRRLAVHVCHLRKVVGGVAEIKNRRGNGYRLVMR